MEREVLPDGAALGDRFIAVLGTPDGAGWTPVTHLFGDGLAAAL
ncbi:MAG: hypothetical protein QOG20_2023, partial [Pseudonocardiales bacterium]|nr:hypothetical protein [Pseudonocardiales bacterium]